MPEEYVNKNSLKYMVNLTLATYEKKGVESVEIGVIREDLFNVINAMSSIDLEAVVRKIEKLVGGVK